MGKRIRIDFDGVYQDSYIYVNGRLVGNYPNGYVPFSFDLTDYVVCDGKTENVIAVSVTNTTNEDKAGYTSRWYSGSGIYRDVYYEPLAINREGKVAPVQEIFQEHGQEHLVLMGEGGIGKTTFLAHQMSALLKDREQIPGPIPIYIDLNP